jgi:hypothetical protein
MATQDGNRAERDRRAARNEALFREVNEQIEHLGRTAGFKADGQLEFACECPIEACARTISMTIGQYEGVRRDATHFFVLPGHESPDVERVVERTGSYLIVEKFGVAADTALKLDPRARPRARARRAEVD